MGMNSVFEEYIAFRFKDEQLQPIKHPHIPDFESLLHIDHPYGIAYLYFKIFESLYPFLL